MRNIMAHHALACLLALAAAFSTHATTYWVSPNGQQCQQQQCACPQDQPCALNAAFLKKLKPGAHVHLQSGKYPGFVISNLHGSAQQNIIFSGPKQGEAAHVVGNAPGLQDAIELRQSTHIKLQHLKVTGASRAGIRLNNSHYINVSNSTLEQNGVWGIFTNHANYFSAHANTIIGPAQQHGIYQSNSGDNVSIIGNYIVNFDGCAVHFNGDLSMGGAEGVPGDGIISNIEIRDNFFAGNGSRGGSAINLDGVDGGIISNNILIDNKATGIAVFKHDGAHGSKGITIERNLIIMAPNSRAAINFFQSEGQNSLQRNIIVAQHPSRGIYDVQPVELGVSRADPIRKLPFTASNNHYSFSKNFALFNGRRQISLQQWQNQGEDKNASTIKLSYMLLPLSTNYNLDLPAELKQLSQQHNIVTKHPYQHLLRTIND